MAKSSAQILAEIEDLDLEIAKLRRTPLDTRIGQTSMRLKENLEALERQRKELMAELRIARTLEGRARPLERRLY